MSRRRSAGPAVGLQRERLGRVRSLNESESRLAPPSTVVAVARLPAEAVEVAAEQGDVGALAAADVVEAGAADQAVVARAADQHVVAAPPASVSSSWPRRADDVVAAAAVDRQERRARVHELTKSGRAARSSRARSGRPPGAEQAVVRPSVGHDLKDVGRGQVGDREVVSPVVETSGCRRRRVRRRRSGRDPRRRLELEPLALDREACRPLAAVDTHAVDLARRRTRTTPRRA